MCNFKHEKKNTKKGSRADDKKEAPKDKKAKSSSSQSNQLTEGTTVHIGGEDFILVKSTGTKTQRNNSSKNQQSSYKPSAPKDPKIGAEQNSNNIPKNVQQKNGSEGKEQINFRDPEISRYNTGSQYWPPVPLAFQQHMFGPRPFQLPFGHPYGGMLY